MSESNTTEVRNLSDADIQEQIHQAGVSSDQLSVVSNPEFLREGTALYDFFHPDRIVIGGENRLAIDRLSELYDPLYRKDTPIMTTTWETSELSKYASNVFLTAKVSFINEMAQLSEACGANIKDLASIMGKDGRIGPYFLHPGPGVGGSCFPKDTVALIQMAKTMGYEFKMGDAILKINDQQRLIAYNALRQFFDSNL